MAGQQSILNTTFVVADALANGVNKYTVAVLDTTTAHQITQTTVLNGKGFIGIIQEDTDAGDEVDVLVEGIGWVTADGAVAVGDELILSATAGQVESNTTAAEATPVVVGTALTTAAEAGDLILMKIA